MNSIIEKIAINQMDWKCQGFKSEAEAIAFALVEWESDGPLSFVVLSKGFVAGKAGKVDDELVWRGLMELSQRPWVSVFTNVHHPNSFVVTRNYMDRTGELLDEFQDVGFGPLHRRAAEAVLEAHLNDVPGSTSD